MKDTYAEDLGCLVSDFRTSCKMIVTERKNEKEEETEEEDEKEKRSLILIWAYWKITK